MKILTEDEVRDKSKIVLGFNEIEENIQQGTGQITTFNQLGFKGNNNKPDGWYLPNNTMMPAIILETKSSLENIYLPKWENELLKNCSTISSKYKHIVGILYNGKDIRVFKDFVEKNNLSNTLQNKGYYLSLYNKNTIDKQRIYALTKRINECLHKDFGIKNLYHRMIFTACALVAKRYDALLIKGMNFSTMKNSILSTLNKSLEESKKQNLKLDLLAEVYAEIKMNNSTNQEAINNFINWVSEISECVNSDYWNGEDVMGIFFNEFNRYKGKSESGQIFTPDHITSFMYRLINVHMDDKILDATCGSGAFLVKAMCNMRKEAGGINTEKSKQIQSSQLFGIEFDREIFALACANMLIHKDGKTNLEQLDTRQQVACDWIKNKDITKVLMNPPYERKYGCMQIVQNVLENVPIHTECAFILPDKKLEKDFVDKKYGNKLLKNHTLKKIIKLPENLFFGVGITTSIFVFESGVPHNKKNIFACYIEDDGLETVKNQGRQDTKGKWQAIEDKWIKIIENPICKEAEDVKQYIQIVNPQQHLSYQMPEKQFEIYEEDFIKTIIDYQLFQQGVDVKVFNDSILKKVLYSSKIVTNDKGVYIFVEEGESNEKN